jgi:hypothetical protein
MHVQLGFHWTPEEAQLLRAAFAPWRVLFLRAPPGEFFTAVRATGHLEQVTPHEVGGLIERVINMSTVEADGLEDLWKIGTLLQHQLWSAANGPPIMGGTPEQHAWLRAAQQEIQAHQRAAVEELGRALILLTQAQATMREMRARLDG